MARSLLVVALALAAPVAAAPAAAPSQVAFLSGSFEDALAAARQAQRPLLVDVFADWCAPCKRQRAEVFATPEGARLVQSAIAWQVDFEDPRARPLMERLNVLSLPTVLVLRADGTEVDRIEGYETKGAFLAEAQRLLRGDDPLPALLRRLKDAETRGDEAARLRLLVDIGHRVLVRGDAAQGLRLLDEAAVLDIDGRHGAAEDALFLMGRYWSRAKRDFAHGRNVWRELSTRFPSGRYAGTAAWWYASALYEQGDHALAAKVLAIRASAPATAVAREGVEMLVDFAVEKNVGAGDARRAIAAAQTRNILDARAAKELNTRLDAAAVAHAR